MGSGTIIRLIIGLIILLFPPIIVYVSGDKLCWTLVTFYLLIPFLYTWDLKCDCDDCILSSRCSLQKKINLVKNIMMFIGFNNDKIKSININSLNNKSNYKQIYKYIKKQYYEQV